MNPEACSNKKIPQRRFGKYAHPDSNILGISVLLRLFLLDCHSDVHNSEGQIFSNENLSLLSESDVHNRPSGRYGGEELLGSRGSGVHRGGKLEYEEQHFVSSTTAAEVSEK